MTVPPPPPGTRPLAPPPAEPNQADVLALLVKIEQHARACRTSLNVLVIVFVILPAIALIAIVIDASDSGTF